MTVDRLGVLSAALASTEAKVKQLTDKVVITGTDLQTHGVIHHPKSCEID